MPEASVLIVDDEAAIRDMVAAALEVAGFRCLRAENARTAYALIVDEKPDLVLLDWMMPGVTGVELTRSLRKDSFAREIPIIMLTARTEEDDKIRGLNVGADDYVTKPFSPRELIARVHAVMRRSIHTAQEEVLEAGGMRLDVTSHRVAIGPEKVSLGPTEFRLLHFFMGHPDRVYTRSQLLDRVWGRSVYVEERTVDVHIRRLRKVLENHGVAHLVQTVRGAGYRFSAQG
jgi:two-component system phosphate regulon response regulator PhoB